MLTSGESPHDRNNPRPREAEIDDAAVEVVAFAKANEWPKENSPELQSRGIVWISPKLTDETADDAARRCVWETWHADRSCKPDKEGRFTFYGCAWFYRIETDQSGNWIVRKLPEPSKAAKKRARARAEARPSNLDASPKMT